jgi:hypothetical protein
MEIMFALDITRLSPEHKIKLLELLEELIGECY